jgi:RNA chaperone Hfq
MPEPRFIRIGAPSGDGPAGGAPAAPAGEPAAAPGVLPPEVFGVWAEEAPAQPAPDPRPAPAPAVAPVNGRGAASAPLRPRPGATRAGVAPAPALVRQGPPSEAARGGRASHEDERLNAMRRSGRSVEAVCFEGLRVRGRLLAFDQYALVLESDAGETLLFKHGVILLRYAE